MRKFLKYFFRFLLIIIVIALIPTLIFWIQAISLNGVHPTVIEYNQQLKTQLKKDGYKANLIITSAKRWKWHNDFLVWSGSGAAKNSQHLKGKAIDIMVLDVNGDWKCNAKDVDIIYKILDKKIIKNKGGIGTYYKKAGNFFDRQMVHFDARGKRARWRR
jgi:uncharacterized protein YcbK (DUF882 family)